MSSSPFLMDVEVTEYYTFEFTTEAAQAIRYHVQKEHGPDFTDENVWEEIDMWLESRISFSPPRDKEITASPMPKTMERATLLIRDTPYIPPEISGQEKML